MCKSKERLHPVCSVCGKSIISKNYWTGYNKQGQFTIEFYICNKCKSKFDKEIVVEVRTEE